MSGLESAPVAHIAVPDRPDIAVYEYPPAGAARGTVVLVHGILSSNQIFDVPGVPDRSLARFLQDAGYFVFTYDQRGAGQSPTTDWNFGLGELALLELPVVIRHAMQRSGARKVDLGGHSLGGLIGYVLRSALGRSPPIPLDEGSLGKSFVIGSPCWFDASLDPWTRILAQGPAFVQSLEGTEAGLVTRAGFIRGQATLFAPQFAGVLSPTVVESLIAVAGFHPRLASVLRRAPWPNLLFHEDDLGDETLMHVMRSHALHRGPRRLLEELIDSVRRGHVLASHENLTVRIPDDLAVARPFELLTITSHGDRFVPAADVTRVHSIVGGGTSIVCEDEWQSRSGHIGYFLKDGLYEQVFGRVAAFLANPS